MTAPAATAEAFEEHRSILFAIAYRMLGSAAEAEDVVQDTFLRFQAAGVEDLRSPRAYLATIATRLALDRLKSARVQREQYVGPWLPEPVLAAPADDRLNPEGFVDTYDSISTAFLVLLETLTPVERAVFLLHEVFDYSHAEVAEMVGRSEATCRQVARRARQHITARRPRFRAPYARQKLLTETFLRAAALGDLDALKGLLADDVIAYSDGGGKVAAALRPIAGADRCARFIAGVARKFRSDRVDVVDVNGAPAALFWSEGRLHTVVGLEWENDHVVAIHGVRNPDKLQLLSRQLEGTAPPADRGSAYPGRSIR